MRDVTKEQAVQPSIFHADCLYTSVFALIKGQRDLEITEYIIHNKINIEHEEH